ncbi:MAG: transketolase C-terminal domain-containing protein [Patescibacteria group bacterium]
MDIRDALFDEIYRLGEKDKDLIFISDDLDAWGLRKFKRDFPRQFINIGVAEQNLIDVAAGLAASGKKVFVYGICSYVTARCLEQIRFSVCSMNLPVVIIGVGAGFSFSFDGPSHHGIHDIGLMRMLPEVTIFNPIDARSAQMSARLAHARKQPAYIRLDKGEFPDLRYTDSELREGFKKMGPLGDTTVISTGIMSQQIMKFRTKGVVDLFRLQPISPQFISQVLKKSKRIITVEENMFTGGIGSIVSELLTDHGLKIPLKRLAVKNRQFDRFGTREWLWSLSGLDMPTLQKKISRHA